MVEQTAEIGVTYKTSRVGAFTKSITVLSNAVEPRKILKIKNVFVNRKQRKRAFVWYQSQLLTPNSVEERLF